MIPCACLIWVGAKLSAPWWYFALLGVFAWARLIREIISAISKGGEQNGW